MNFFEYLKEQDAVRLYNNKVITKALYGNYKIYKNFLILLGTGKQRTKAINIIAKERKLSIQQIYKINKRFEKPFI